MYYEFDNKQTQVPKSNTTEINTIESHSLQFPTSKFMFFNKIIRTTSQMNTSGVIRVSPYLEFGKNKFYRNGFKVINDIYPIQSFFVYVIVE